MHSYVYASDDKPCMRGTTLPFLRGTVCPVGSPSVETMSFRRSALGGFVGSVLALGLAAGTVPAAAHAGAAPGPVPRAAAPPSLRAAGAPSGPPTVAAARGPTIDLICDDIGRVTLAADPTTPYGARVTDTNALALTGRIGLAARTDTGRQIAAPTQGTGSACHSAATRLDLAAWLRAIGHHAESGATAYGLGIGVITAHVRITATPTPLAADPIAQRFPFESELASYIRARGGEVTVSVRPTGSTRPESYTYGSARQFTASIVKVGIMAAVMDRAQRQGRSLSSWERSKIAPMIQVSDNDAATALFDDIGGGAGLKSTMLALGARDVIVDPAGHWGLTQTSSRDWVMVLGHFAAPGGLINDTNRTYARSLMTTVMPSQAWGITAGPPRASVAVKNGWLQRTTGWHVNSIGWSFATPVPYQIAVETRATGSSQAYQQATIEGVSRIVWARRAQLVATTLGDATGNGTVDLLSVTWQGAMAVLSGNGLGGFASPSPRGGDWSGYSWFGSPGDVDGDGHNDLYGVTKTDGDLVLFRGLGAAAYASGVVVASGWGQYRLVAAVGRFDNNNSPDLLALGPDGVVNHFACGSKGNVVLKASLGRNLAAAQKLFQVGDVTGDGLGDVGIVDDAGQFSVWRSSATGFAKVRDVWRGFDARRLIASPGDLNGDGTVDLVTVTKDTGAMTRYLGRGDGTFAGGVALPTNGTAYALLW